MEDHGPASIADFACGTGITDTLSVLNEGGRWTYFQGLLPVFTHAADDVPSFRMFTAQLAANGHCKLVDIERTFGVTGISVKRAVKQYRDGGGCRAFFEARRGRTQKTGLRQESSRKEKAM